MDNQKTYHQLAIEHPTNVGYRMMADRERMMIDDPHDTLARLRELRELFHLGACTKADAVAAADIIAGKPEMFVHMVSMTIFLDGDSVCGGQVS
jgi:hypothetical protein